MKKPTSAAISIPRRHSDPVSSRNWRIVSIRAGSSYQPPNISNHQ